MRIDSICKIREVNFQSIMKRTVVIDAISLLGDLTGIGRYTYEVSKRLKDSDLDINFYYGYYSKLLIKSNSKVAIKSIRGVMLKNRVLKRVARKIFKIVSKISFSKYDLYWQPNIIPNSSVKAKMIISTVHDFSFLHYPSSHPKERIDYFKANFNKEVKKSSHIITGSHYTKDEIINYLGFKKEQITVIYHGIDHKLFKLYPKDRLNATSQKYNLPKKFILSVGSIEPRKNLLMLLKAYNTLKEDIQKEHPLFLVGAKGWKNQDIMNEISSSKYIKYLGYLSDIELACIYNLATLFVYPSLYEGFGLPPLEAMACGTPVITSQKTSMSEVCKNAALYVDPLNQNDIANQIEKLLMDKDMQTNLSEEGLKRSKEFTWEKSSQEHLKLFKKVLDTIK